MNILHINSYYSTSGLFRQLYDRQIDSGMDLDVYVPISHEYPEDRLAVKDQYSDVVRVFNQRDRFIFPMKHHKILDDLKERYNFHQYDLIHAHSLFSNGWLAYQLHQAEQIPYVVAVRSTDLHTFFEKMPWMRKTGIEILNAASAIIFISRNTQQAVFNKFIPEKYQTAFAEKTYLIPNGIDDFWLKDKYTDKSLRVHQPIRVLAVGKLIRAKRLRQLANLTKAYCENYAPLELHIAGPPWNEYIQGELEQYDHVRYHGALNQQELKALMREMDIFALLSYPETFGLVYPEAMSQGLPVIYTRGQGFDSFFENYDVGVSVAKNDQIGFNQAMDFIVRHYEDITTRALDYVDVFDWNDIQNKYQTLYEQIVEEK